MDWRVEPDRAAERLRERLMAEAHAQGGDARLRHLPRELDRDARLLRRARTGRDHAAFVTGGEQLGDGRTIVADRVHVGAELAQVLHEVVGEGVVVVEHEDAHRRHGHSSCSHASSIACVTAVVLATDSSYS